MYKRVQKDPIMKLRSAQDTCLRMNNSDDILLNLPNLKI